MEPVETGGASIDGNTETSMPVRKNIIHTKHYCFTVEKFEMETWRQWRQSLSLFFQKVQT